jgi:hypothetical protein
MESIADWLKVDGFTWAWMQFSLGHFPETMSRTQIGFCTPDLSWVANGHPDRFPSNPSTRGLKKSPKILPRGSFHLAGILLICFILGGVTSVAPPLPLLFPSVRSPCRVPVKIGFDSVLPSFLVRVGVLEVGR